MDPVTAFGLAAGIAQFATIAVQLGKRIQSFSRASAELPEALKDIASRLEIFASSLENMKRDIEEHPEHLNKQARERWKEFLVRLESRCHSLETILDNYLPAGDDSSFSKTKKALLSIKSDERIAAISTSLKDDVTFLTFLQVTSMQQRGRPTSASVDERLRGKSFYNVQRRRVHQFFGREDILDEVDDSLRNSSGHEPRVLVLLGMGGQGKTQTALEYCRRSRQQKKYSGIFWVDASSKESMQRSFEPISDMIKAEDQSFADTDAKVANVKSTLSEWSSNWLIVFDNYDNPGEFSISYYFPVSENGHVLITSRSHGLQRIGNVIEVQGMDEEDALALLLDRMDIVRDEESTKYGNQITKRLGYLPLAIDQAGAYLKNQKEILPLSMFLQHYEDHRRDILGAIPPAWEYIGKIESGQQQDSAKSIFTTWNMSVQLLEPSTESGSRKVAILDLLAYFDEKDISEEHFSLYCAEVRTSDTCPLWMTELLDERGEWSKHKFADIMLQFKDLSLITSRILKDDGFVHVSLHPMVRDWIRIRHSRLQTIDCIRVASEMLATSMLKGYWYRSWYTNWTLWAGFRISNSKKRELIAHLAVWKSNFASVMHDISPTLLCFKGIEVIKAAEEVFADFYHEFLQCEDSLILSQWLWEKTDINIPDLQHLKLQANQFIIDNSIALLREEEAVIQARNAVKHWSAIEPPESSIFSVCKYYLCMALTRAGTPQGFVDSERICRQQLASLQTVYADKYEMSIEYQTWQCELVEALTGQHHVSSRFSEAESIAHSAFLSTERLGGSSARKRLWSYRCWDLIAGLDCDTEVCLQLCEEFYEAMRQQFGEDNSGTISSRAKLASVLIWRENEPEQAEEVLRECTRYMAGADFSARDSVQAEVFEVLGDCLREQGKFDEARIFYNQALESFSMVVPSASEKAANIISRTMQSMAIIGDLKDEISNSIAWYTLRLRFCENLGRDFEILRTILDLAEMKTRLEGSVPLEEAIVLVCRALGYFLISPAPRVSPGSLILQDLDLEKRQYGFYGFDVMIQLARCNVQLGNIDDADKQFRAAVFHFQRLESMTKEEVRYFISEVSILSTWADDGPLLSRGVEYAEWALNASRSKFGEDDELTKTCRSRLGDLQKEVSFTSQREKSSRKKLLQKLGFKLGALRKK